MLFFDSGSEAKLGENNKLVKLEKIIKWYRISKHLKGLHKNSMNSAGGPIAYDALKMFKSILLGQWHSLSDAALEESLRVRLDFMVFSGFRLTDNTPDTTTLNRFRNILISKGILPKLLTEINKQLERSGLKIKAATGAIIDASLIESAARPKKMLETQAVDREETSYVTTGESQTSHDPDARWLKKGNKYYHGYKAFCSVDNVEGYIENIFATPANESEITKLPELVNKMNNPKRVYGDKGYASQANRDLLRSKKIKNGLMYKAQKNKPLTKWQKTFNILVAKCRYKVEQTFAILKRIFKFSRASYMTTAKVTAQLLLKAMCYNLLRGVNKVIAFNHI